MLATGPASAAQNKSTAANQATAACRISAGSVTAGGDQRIQTFVATKPITRTENRIITTNLWPNGEVRLSSTWTTSPHAELPGIIHRGLVVRGDVLYDSSYLLDLKIDRDERRVGAGWTPFRAVEQSEVLMSPTSIRRTAYGLRSDGTLLRWNLVSNGPTTTWRPSGTAAGYGGVKSMALISQTKTYDTFLMNGRDGALLTVHIPTTSPMKPIVKKVRTSTWQAFETMMGARCGNYGTLLLGIDKDTGVGYLYAVGHGAGVIQGLGRAPVDFIDPVLYAQHDAADPQLFGE
jgi:hypothetical protein